MGEFLSYALESGLIMAMLYLTYKWLMASGTLHGFKRAVLMVILVQSWAVPSFIPMIHMGGSDSVVDIAMPIPVDMIENVGAGMPGTTAWSWAQLLCLVYPAGVVATALYTMAGVVRMVSIIRSGICEDNGRYTLVVTGKAPAPFSWGRYIVIRPEDCDEYKELVVRHEAAHLSRLHWIDLIFCQLNVILQWYNPASWLLMRELKNVHEYQADAMVAGEHPYNYQIMLIKKAVGSSFPTFANSLNHSQLKTRLTMMLKPKSKATRCVAALAIPVMTMAAVFILSVPTVAGALTAVKTAEMPGNDSGKVTKTAVTGQAPEAKAETAQSAPTDDIVVMAHGTIAKAEQKNPVKKVSEPMTTDPALYITDDSKSAAQPAIFINDQPFTGDMNKISPDIIGSITVLKDDPAYPQGKVMVNLKGYKDEPKTKIAPVSVAEFNGGAKALMQFIAENVKFPAGVKIEGMARTVVRFTIGADGNVSNPEILKSCKNDALDAEAVRVVALTDGQWKPAIDEKGVAVRTTYVVPVIFKQ